MSEKNTVAVIFLEGYNVSFFTKDNGVSPVKEFISGLDPKMKAKVLREISLLEQFGPQLREPDSKALGDGIFELRIKFSSNITRVLYFFYTGKNIVLTNGFIKKSDKTPPAVILFAKKCRDEYMSRKEHSHE